MARRTAVWALALAGVVGLGGCGGAGGASRADRLTEAGAAEVSPAAPASPTTTTTSSAHRERAGVVARPRSGTSHGTPPWPGGDTTAAPNVVDHGDDYAAIWRSLDRYRTWLEQHHPDPALVSRVWVNGSAIAARFRHELGSLAAHHVRWIDVGERLQVRVASVVDHEVTLLVDEQNNGTRVIDDHGRVLDSLAAHLDAHYIVLMDRDAAGHWRIASLATRITSDTEVQL